MPEQGGLRIGILGGSFDPPHIAHLMIAQEAWYRFELSHVCMIPAFQNPLKEAEIGASAEQRMAMLRLACEADARFRVEGLEIRRGGKSYTIDTLRQLAQREPGSELYLLMGSDAAETLPQWKDVQQFGELCTIAVFSRPGEAALSGELAASLRGLGLRFEFMPVPGMDVSSSDIRRRVRQNRPIRYFVSDSVAEYIHMGALYR